MLKSKCKQIGRAMTRCACDIHRWTLVLFRLPRKYGDQFSTFIMVVVVISVMMLCSRRIYLDQKESTENHVACIAKCNNDRCCVVLNGCAGDMMSDYEAIACEVVNKMREEAEKKEKK